MGLARHEKDFDAATETAIDIDELLGALRRPVAGKSDRRSETIAHCLSGGAGWRDAATTLGGAFAKLGKATRLTQGKE